MQPSPGGTAEDCHITSAEPVASLEKLASLIRRYRDAATGPYQNNPEASSAMQLTIMELWAALDASATTLIPLLLEYSHGIPTDFFDGLVLPRPGQLERLARLEQYLERRRAAAGSNGPPWQLRAANGSWSDTSFAVRYYDTSHQHVQLRRDIIHAAEKQLAIDRAKAESAAKDASLAQKQWQSMASLASRGVARVLSSVGTSSDSVDAAVAAKRRELELAEAKVAEMWSTYFVWPLPENMIAAKVFVFETRVPDAFAVWREATLDILAGFWPAEEAHSKSSSYLPLVDRPTWCRGHPIIQQLARPDGDRKQRFQLALPTTARGKSPRYLQSRSGRLEEPYCIKFALDSRDYYDISLPPLSSDTPTLWQRWKRVATGWQRYPATTASPVLQKFIHGTAHTSNQVLATQSQRPESMTPEEFRAFGSLRAGRWLQWQNILLQLAIPSIDFSRPEVFFLVMQAANEMGPREEGCGLLRSTHAILGDRRFGDTLLLALEDTLGRTTRKPEPEVLFGILVSLAVKLLSASPSQAVQERCLAYLRRLRHETADRARRLCEQLRSCGEADEQRRDRLKDQVYMMMLLCHNTFDVGTVHGPSLLADSDESALLIEASIRAAEHTPPLSPGSPNADILDLFSHRQRRLSQELEPQLKCLIVTRGSPCLDKGILRVWASHETGEAWSAAPPPQEHVLTCDLVAAATRDTLSLQYNLLTGSLLVNGSPFSTLPASFREHTTYRRAFGTYDFTVVPSHRKSQGMEYLATSMYYDHVVHFGMFEGGSELVVQAEKDGTLYELIPPESLVDDFSSALIEDYVHWLVPSLKRIEFRPLSMAWQTLADAASSARGQYHALDLSGGTVAARLTRPGSFVSAVDTRSKTANAIHAILRSLELPRFIDLAYDKAQSAVSIKLQRLGLDFRLASGTATIASEQYQGYVVDSDQALGALSNLKSKLILVRRPCDELTGQLSDARLVLIPIGQISIGPGGAAHQSPITIVTNASDRVRHHAFPVDTMLGCLRDSGAVGAKLLLCQLHAVTTYHLPDRLTNRTGTDEALRILRSTTLQSAELLEQEDIDRLRQISLMRPIWGVDNEGREALEWNGTTPWAAQDSALGELAQATLDKTPGSTPSHGAKPVGQRARLLMRRQAIRTTSYLVSQYAVPEWQSLGRELDVEYQYKEYGIYLPTKKNNRKQERDNYITAKFNRELEVCRLAAHMADTGEEQVSLLHPIPQHYRFFASVPKSTRVHGTSSFRARFHADWTQEPPREVAIGTWCDVLGEVDAMRQGERPEKHVFKLIFFLAGLIFAPKAELELVQILLAVATAPVMERYKAVGSWRPWPRSGTGLLRDIALAIERARTLDSKKDGSKRHFKAIEHLRACLAALIEFISGLPIRHAGPAPYLVSKAFLKPTGTGSRGFFCLQDMFSQQAPPFNPGRLPETFTWRHPGLTVRGKQVPQALPRLLQDLQGLAKHKHDRSYVQELRHGLGLLLDGSAGAASPSPASREGGGGDLRSHLLLHRDACHRNAADMFSMICEALTDTVAPPGRPIPSSLMQMPSLSVRLPAITPMMLLERLSRGHRGSLSKEWLQCLCDYAVSLTTLQRAERMVRASVDDDEMLARELQNVGHENWGPVMFPDWLLLEVEMDILIRPVQSLVASAMMSPPGALNHVMQLNVGQGKSSVVIPMVAAALADGSHLVRVIVAKPQSKQMLHTLHRAFGGLLGRQVLTLPPFSRGMDVHDRDGSRDYHANLWAACAKNGGILIAQPEHILSLSLSGLETALTAVGAADSSKPGNLNVKDRHFENDWLRLRHFLDANARDIIDESDEILSAKSELAYTMGDAAPIDLGQLRWRMIQGILGIVADVAAAIGQEHPDHVEFTPSQSGRFPLIRILDEDGADILTKKVVSRILGGTLAGFAHVANRKNPVRKAVFKYITHLEPEPFDTAVVAASFTTEEVQGQLLLLRGLMAHKVLCFALQKRWRVNYGRSVGRKQPASLAVPYRAKDSPTPRSDFSHPDLVMVLTCLTYYYDGLRDDELFHLIQRLLLSVDGERIYQAWVQSAPNMIPPASRQLAAINIQDRELCIATVFPHLRYLRAAIDYHLSHIVFPREMREFPQKLSESAWSLVAARVHPVTGFSGTNDTKDLLPKTIKFLDLDAQRNTNALVLGYLLDSNNTVRCMPAAERSTRPGDDLSPTMQLLHTVVRSAPPIRVIIDAGAQIVDLDNAETARRWLAMVPAAEASAAVFFNNDDNICVVVRDGTTELFWGSSYSTNMASCLVYLDEAHTRGTDLRLPSNYRAAVTLGPGLTKDRLVQACMRMRELGHGQSFALFAPTEVQRKIMALRGIPKGGEIEVADVLAWSITETWHEARRLRPLWEAQGLRQSRHRRLWKQADKGDGYLLGRDTAKQFLERGSLTLRERYHPGGSGSTETVEGEQERELLAQLVEITAKVSLPRVEARKSSIHPDLVQFVETAAIPADSPAFLHAFDAVQGSSVAHDWHQQGLRWPYRLPLLVTAGFARPVRIRSSDNQTQALDAYQRPVQWICTATAAVAGGNGTATTMVAVVLSPYEANALMPLFLAGRTAARLHLFAPRTSLDTRSAEDLLLFALPAPAPGWHAPRALVLMLLLFSGQLYLRTYGDYVAMCRLLGVRYRAVGDGEEEGGEGGEDDDDNDDDDDDDAMFGPEAVPFFQKLYERVRHPEADLSNTDVGCILAGDVLPPSAFSGSVRAR